MELENFIENFAALFDETDRTEFKGDSEFKEMEEWSSLIALSVIAMVNEEYEVDIKGDDIRNSKTIADLFTVVSLKVD